MEKKTSGLNLDLFLLFSSIALITIGIFFIYSSGVRSTGEQASSEYIKQIIWAAVAILVMLFLSFFNYNLLKDASLYLYIGFLVLLFLTLFIGKVVNGSKSWIGLYELGGQPSEFVKIFTVLFLAKFLSENKHKIDKLPFFLLSFLIVLIPIGLILRQPDLGTALVFFPVFLFMTYLAGAKIKHILFFLFTAIFTIIFTIFPAYEEKSNLNTHSIWSFLSEPFLLIITASSLIIIIGLSLWGYIKYKRKTFFWILFFSSILLISIGASYAARNFLQDYQMQRLTVFINPYKEERSAGWNLIQSLTAVGNGGLLGKGFLQGTQSHYQFLPMQSTDFIFSILSEEIGFLGVTLIFGLFIVIILRSLYIITLIKDNYAVLVIGGFVGMIFTHVFVNIGMTIGILPITGIPLFFLSYGGSSLVAAAMAIGITMNISMRRFMF